MTNIALKPRSDPFDSFVEQLQQAWQLIRLETNLRKTGGWRGQGKRWPPRVTSIHRWPINLQAHTLCVTSIDIPGVAPSRALRPI